MNYNEYVLLFSYNAVDINFEIFLEYKIVV